MRHLWKSWKYWNLHVVASLVKCVVANLSPRIFALQSFWDAFRSFWTHRIPLNSAACFFCVLIITTCQSHGQFWDFGLKGVSFEMTCGQECHSTSFSSIGRTCSEKFVHWIHLTFRLLSMSFLDAPGCSFFVGLSSLSLATNLSNSNSELVGMWSGSMGRPSSTLRFFPRHVTIQEVRCSLVVEGTWISVPLMSWYRVTWTWRTGPLKVSPGDHCDSGIRIFAGMCVFSACSNFSFKNHHRTSGMVLKLIPIETLFTNVASWQTLENWILFFSVSDLCRTLSPSVFRCPIVTRRSLHQRIHFLRFRYFSVDACFFLLRIFSWSTLSDSESVEQTLLTPAWNCSADVELMCWVDCAKQEFCVRWILIEVCGTSAFFPFSEFHDSKHWCVGCPISLRCPTILATMESHFPSSKLRVLVPCCSSTGPKNDQCPCENLFMQFLTCSDPNASFWISFLNIGMMTCPSKIFRFNVFNFASLCGSSAYVCQAPNAFICVSPCGKIPVRTPFGAPVRVQIVLCPWIRLSHFGSISSFPSLICRWVVMHLDQAFKTRIWVFGQECTSLDC